MCPTGKVLDLSLDMEAINQYNKLFESDKFPLPPRPITPPPDELSSSSANSNLRTNLYSGRSSPAGVFTPTSQPQPTLYNLSGGEMSSDGLSGRHSPSFSSSVPRCYRFNSVAAPATRAKVSRRRSTNSMDSDDDDDDANFQLATNSTTTMRRETIRRQRIESEQRRRDELRNGYRKLKDALPVREMCSKVSLLDRATSHVKDLEAATRQLEIKLQEVEAEMQRQRTVNEALMLLTAEQRNTLVAAVTAVSPRSH